MILWAAVLGVGSLLSQGEGAILSGVVSDGQTGLPVAGASIALTDLDRRVTSAGDGRYFVASVPAGLQHLEVSRIGYASRTLHAFVPPAGRLEIRVMLAPQPITLAGVEVSPPVPIRSGAREDGRLRAGTVALAAASLRNHPLLPEPDAFAALAGGAVAVAPESPAGLHVRGGAADQVAFLLDGLPILDPYHAAGLFSALNPDALARIALEPAPPSAAAPEAIAGVVSAATRPAGERLRSLGAISTQQARVTIDGPLPLPGDGGFLVSARRGFPGFPLPDDEPSYLQGSAADGLAKGEFRVGGGQLRLLAWRNRNRTAAAAGPSDGASEAEPPPRHDLRWSGGSVGADWSRSLPAATVELRAWRAGAEAEARWTQDESSSLRLETRRKDTGAGLVVGVGPETAPTRISLRVERKVSDYRVRTGPLSPDAAGGRASVDASVDAFAPTGDDRATGMPGHGTMAVVAASVEHARNLGSGVRLEGAVTGTLYGAFPRLSPRFGVEWTPRDRVTASVVVLRTHQAAQSLANAESVVGYVFPAGLSALAGARGVPVAESDHAIVAVELRPGGGLRLAGEAYARRTKGLVLVAPETALPFAVEGFAFGSAGASGAALELSLTRARWGMHGSYGLERTRISHESGSYVPASARAHALAVGVVTRPGAGTTLRAGVMGLAGRRSTSVLGPFEWEACNLLDQGCEFAGSPAGWGGALGGARPPAYLRLDLGARRHWHLRIGGRDAEMGAYATVANVLGRRNLLTRVDDPAAGRSEWIEMQSRVPLVFGLDWRF